MTSAVKFEGGANWPFPQCVDDCSPSVPYWSAAETE